MDCSPNVCDESGVLYMNVQILYNLRRIADVASQFALEIITMDYQTFSHIWLSLVVLLVPQTFEEAMGFSVGTVLGCLSGGLEREVDRSYPIIQLTKPAGRHLPRTAYIPAPLPTNTTEDLLENCHSNFPNALNICGGAKASKTALWNSRAEEPLIVLDCPKLERCAAARCEECQ